MKNNNKPPQLRPMNLNDDLHTIANLIELCFKDTLDGDGSRFIRKMREAANSTSVLGAVKLANLPQKGFVWKEDGMIAGNISLVTVLFNSRPSYLIANVAVHPDYRMRGIAKSLTKEALEFVKARRIKNVLLQANSANQVAVDLYKNFGFIEIAQRTNWHAYPEKNIDVNSGNGIEIRSRISNDWAQQKQWLKLSYPKSVTWHMSFKEKLLKPGFLPYLNRLLNDQSIKQWSALKDDKLLGTISWQSSRSMADYLWLGVDPEYADESIVRLLTHVRSVSKPGRILSVNYPAGKNIPSFVKAGFKEHHSLTWMKLEN